MIDNELFNDDISDEELFALIDNIQEKAFDFHEDLDYYYNPLH